MEHAVIQLISIIYFFNENKYTRGIFIDLSKTFDTADYDILLKKWDLYGIKRKNLKYFHSYLTNRKRFIKYCDQNTNFIKFFEVIIKLPGILLNYQE